jgi:hypothetical protein
LSFLPVSTRNLRVFSDSKCFSDSKYFSSFHLGNTMFFYLQCTLMCVYWVIIGKNSRWVSNLSWKRQKWRLFLISFESPSKCYWEGQTPRQPKNQTLQRTLGNIYFLFWQIQRDNPIFYSCHGWVQPKRNVPHKCRQHLARSNKTTRKLTLLLCQFVSLGFIVWISTLECVLKNYWHFYRLNIGNKASF